MVDQDSFHRFAMENGDSWGVQPEDIEGYLVEAVDHAGTWKAHVEACVKALDAGEIAEYRFRSSVELTALMSDFRTYLKAS